MFRLYHSNDLDVLKELLVHQMRQGDSDPFIPEQILVQSQGMAHWLKLQIAESLGIAANIEFPLPSSFVWKVYNSVKPDLPERSHFEKESMTWKLMKLLPSLLDEELFAPVAHYLRSDQSINSALDQQKVYALAEKIADTFDQYLVYRPDWLLAWEAGEDEIQDGDVSSQPWQPELWRRLIQESEKLDHSLYHRARLTDQLVDIVRSGKEGLKTLLPTSSETQGSTNGSRIFVFGIAALPGSYWQVLNAISEYVDVHFFLLNPCRNYWGDIVNEKTRAKLLQRDASLAEYFTVGNPLLASWGKLGRDFITLTHEAANEAGREGLFQDVEAFVENSDKNRNLLKNIRNDFLQLKDRSRAAYSDQSLSNSQDKLSIARNDNSIQFISAHSPLREVQTLFDQMLSWFDEDAKNNPKGKLNEASLKPRDILVMVPDIDTYAPYIEAVFGSAADDLRIPWAIADQALNKENLVIDAFLRLLQLPNSRLTITDVIELLEVPAIAQHFDIELTELEQIKLWLNTANIRWGLDEGHRYDLGLPSWDGNTWFKGLQQLLLGLVMPDNARAMDQYWPVPSVLGSQGELLGKLMAFVDQLAHWYQLLKYQADRANAGQVLKRDDWQTLLLKLITDFFPAQSNNEQGLKDQLVIQKIRDQIQRWQQELELAAFDEGISHGVVLQYLTACLTKQVGWQRFLAGPVNFCTLMPMRSIPFKIVCMLGMNDEDYPRRVPSQGFDLMAQGGYRRGDRSRREDDRYLFMEAVIAAQDKLYISYRGRDSRENNELQPCVLVSELIDYIANGYVLKGDEGLAHKVSEKNLRKNLIEAQRLQPFNRDYFLIQKGVSQQNLSDKELVEVGSYKSKSYHKLWQQVAQAEQETKPTRFISQLLQDDRDHNSRLTLELNDIKQCLINPAKFFLQRRLKINLTQYWDETDIDEPFALDALQSYLLNEAIIEKKLLGQAEIFKQQQKSLGNLPAAGFADFILTQSENKVLPLLEVINEQVTGSDSNLPPYSASVNLADYQLSGQLEHLVERDGVIQIVHFRSAGFNAKQLLGLWLEHLFNCACEPLVTEKKNKQTNSIGNSIGLGISKEGEVQRHEFTPVKAELAKDYLLQLIEFLNICYCQPQAFFLQLAWNYFNTEGDKADELLANASANEYSELNDEYVWRCFSDVLLEDEMNFLSSQISQWQQIIQPMLDHKLEQVVDDQ
jgi:exodeoxyribonuclease V gamma subunit